MGSGQLVAEVVAKGSTDLTDNRDELLVALRAVDVSLVRGGRTVLNGVQVSCPRGSVMGLLGPNGAGKTSFLRVCTGLVAPSGGSVHVLGSPVCAHVMPARVGALVEEPRFYPWLTARENLKVVAAGRADRLGRIAEVLAVVGLDARADEKVSRYSQGMRQRLGIGRALLGDPSLLLLDEPTNGLDPAGFRWIRSLVSALHQRGITVVIASHILSEVQVLCSDVVIFADGVVAASGSVEEVLSGKRSLEEVFFSVTDGR